MLSAGLMVSLLLATHGDEGSREEKFRGALLAQNAATVTDTAAIRREIEVLTLSRPSFIPAVLMIAIGGGIALVGGVVMLGVYFGAPSWSALTAFWFGAIGAAFGAVVAVIGLIVLATTSVVRDATDDRLKELRRQLKGAAPSALATPGLVLARF